MSFLLFLWAVKWPIYTGKRVYSRCPSVAFGVGESSDAEGEGGEEVEEEEEGSGDEPEPNIVCGTQVEVKVIKDGKYG